MRQTYNHLLGETVCCGLLVRDLDCGEDAAREAASRAQPPASRAGDAKRGLRKARAMMRETREGGTCDVRESPDSRGSTGRTALGNRAG